MALALSVEGGQQLPSTSQLPSEPTTSLQQRAGPNGAAAAAASASLAGTPGAAKPEETTSMAASADVSNAARESPRTSHGDAHSIRSQVGCSDCCVICKLGNSDAGRNYKGRGRSSSCCCSPDWQLRWYGSVLLY